MVDDVDLVEDNGRIQHVERRVVNGSREYDVLEELQPVCMVNLATDGIVSDRDRLVETRRLAQEVPVVGFVVGELWVVCTMRLGWSTLHDRF